MSKIIGVEIYNGEFNGVKYETAILTLEKVYPDEKKKSGQVVGVCAEVQKIKASVLRDFETQLRINGHGGVVGKNVRLLFDKYNKVAMIQLIE